MKAAARQYDHKQDYEKVNRLLVRTYGSASGGHENWLQPRWEYMHYHPHIRETDLSAIGVWEGAWEIVEVVHPQHAMGTAYFEIYPNHRDILGDMLAYAEEHISVADANGRRLCIDINDRDEEFQALAADRAMGPTDVRVEHAQVVVDLRDRPDG